MTSSGIEVRAEEKRGPLKSRPLAQAVITFALNMPEYWPCCGGIIFSGPGIGVLN